MPSPKLTPPDTLFLLCDVQSKFSSVIYGYEHVVATSNKMIKLAELLGIPLICTTQNTAALGPIDPAIHLDSLGPLLLGTFDKTLFSMVTQDLQSIIFGRQLTSIVIFGIESHICILQTVLSLLLLKGFTVHVVADGVSSCNSFEIPIALDRMRSEGAIIGTSESIAFQLMGDASLSSFKPFSKFINQVKESTKAAGETLFQGQPVPPVGQAEIARGDVIKSAM